MKRFGHVLGSPCQNLCQPAQTSLLELTRPWIRERISLEVLAEVSAGSKEKTCSKVSKRVKQTVFVTIRCRVFSKCMSSRLFGRDATSVHFPQARNATQGDFPPKKPSKKLLWPRCFAIFFNQYNSDPNKSCCFFSSSSDWDCCSQRGRMQEVEEKQKFSWPTQMRPLPVANTVKLALCGLVDETFQTIYATTLCNVNILRNSTNELLSFCIAVRCLPVSLPALWFVSERLRDNTGFMGQTHLVRAVGSFDLLLVD